MDGLNLRKIETHQCNTVLSHNLGRHINANKTHFMDDIYLLKLDTHATLYFWIKFGDNIKKLIK